MNIIDTGTPAHGLPPSGGSPAGTEGGGNPQNSQNNAIVDLDPASFWEVPDDNAATSGTPPAPKPEPQPNAGANPFQPILDGIKDYKPNGFMTPDVLREMSENKFDGFDAGLAKMSQDLLSHSTRTTAQLFESIVPQIISHVKGMMESQFESKDKNDFLGNAIPAAKNPATRAVVQAVFDQALVKTKGNREQALTLAKRQMQAMAAAMSPDDEQTNPPGNPGGGRRDPTPTTDWFSELGIHVER